MRKTVSLIALCALAVLLTSTVGLAASRVKLRGYISARPDAQSLAILDDVIHLSSSTRFELQNPNSGGSTKQLALADLVPGILIEAEGRWTGKHQFAAEKINCDAEQFNRNIREYSFLQTEPEDGEAIASGKPARLKTDGELLVIDEKTRREWKSNPSPALQTVSANDEKPSDVKLRRLVGRQVQYEGVRQPDGTIAAGRVELGSAPPSDAYKIPGNRVVARSVDPQTKIDILEIRKGDKVEGRLKLFSENEVQKYVTDLGMKLLPPSADVTARALEFRFYVVEDPSINAAALPDGTVLVFTGLLGAMENESQLAFVLSHEIAHVLQAHQWREAKDTRASRVMLIIAAVAGSYFVGDVGLFLGQLGLAAVVNGYTRRIENQADRLALQNVIDKGYDPRTAVTFFRTMIDHYGDRSTSALWSSHDSSVLRGSFLVTQLARQYPQGKFDNSIVDTDKFKAMKEVMGPVKIM
jgi:peptidase M48-like protein/uncharacterized protein DUF5666